MSSATNSHNYLYENWARSRSPGPISANGPVFWPARVQVSHRYHCSVEILYVRELRLHISRLFEHFTYSLFVECGGYAICAVQVDSRHAAVYVETFELSEYHVDVVCQISLTLHCLSVKHRVFVSMLKHKRVVETQFLSSGSPQGLSSPMLVVIFLSCHCSLLCSPSFLIILSAIYQTMKSERKKKLNLSFLCIMAYVMFLEEKCFVCSLFTCRKKELVVCRNDPVLFLFCFLLFVSFNSLKGFQ